MFKLQVDGQDVKVLNDAKIILFEEDLKSEMHLTFRTDGVTADEVLDGEIVKSETVSREDTRKSLEEIEGD